MSWRFNVCNPCCKPPEPPEPVCGNCYTPATELTLNWPEDTLYIPAGAYLLKLQDSEASPPCTAQESIDAVGCVWGGAYQTGLSNGKPISTFFTLSAALCSDGIRDFIFKYAFLNASSSSSDWANAGNGFPGVYAWYSTPLPIGYANDWTYTNGNPKGTPYPCVPMIGTTLPEFDLCNPVTTLYYQSDSNSITAVGTASGVSCLLCSNGIVGCPAPCTTGRLNGTLPRTVAIS